MDGERDKLFREEYLLQSEMSETTKRERKSDEEEDASIEGEVLPADADIPEDANVVDLRNSPNWMQPRPDDEQYTPVSEMSDDELEEFNEKLERMLAEAEDEP